MPAAELPDHEPHLRPGPRRRRALPAGRAGAADAGRRPAAAARAGRAPASAPASPSPGSLRRRRAGDGRAHRPGATSPPAPWSTPPAPGAARSPRSPGCDLPVLPAPRRSSWSPSRCRRWSATRSTPPSTSPTSPATTRPGDLARSSRAPAAGTVLIGASRERVGFDRAISLPVLRRLAAAGGRGCSPCSPTCTVIRSLLRLPAVLPRPPAGHRPGSARPRAAARVRPRGRRHRAGRGDRRTCSPRCSPAPAPALDLEPLPARPVRGGPRRTPRAARAASTSTAGPSPFGRARASARRCRRAASAPGAPPGSAGGRAACSAASASASTAWSRSTGGPTSGPAWSRPRPGAVARTQEGAGRADQRV